MPLHLFFASHPHVVCSKGRLPDLIVAPYPFLCGQHSSLAPPSLSTLSLLGLSSREARKAGYLFRASYLPPRPPLRLVSTPGLEDALLIRLRRGTACSLRDRPASRCVREPLSLLRWPALPACQSLRRVTSRSL